MRSTAGGRWREHGNLGLRRVPTAASFTTPHLRPLTGMLHTRPPREGKRRLEEPRVCARTLGTCPDAWIHVCVRCARAARVTGFIQVSARRRAVYVMLYVVRAYVF